MKATIIILFLTFVTGCVALIANVPTFYIVKGLTLIVVALLGALVGELIYTVVKGERFGGQ